MVTEISGTGFNHSVASQIGATAVKRLVGSVSPEDAGLPQPGVARDKQTSATTQVAGAYAQLRVRQDALNKAASVVREVGNTVEQAGRLLDKVENKLSQIVKMYPPYPVDNQQRIALLDKIASMRKMLDGLTFPRPDTVDSVGRLLGTQAISKAGDAAAKQNTVAGVKDRMWDLPKLDPLAASDAEVSKALDQVKAVKSSLQDLQTGMWNNVVSFVKQAESPEAQNKAAGIREQLVDLGGRGIGSNARQMEQAVESK